MPRGMRCPHCQENTYHDKSSYRECANCGYIGWSWYHKIADVGQGRGNTCPWCSQYTLHDIKIMDNGLTIRRCTTCNYTALEPSS